MKNYSTRHRADGDQPGEGPTHYSSDVINALFFDGSGQYLSLTGRSAGGSILAKYSKTVPDARYDAYQGIYHTSYMAAQGFSAVVRESSSNANPFPMEVPAWSVATVRGRSCADAPAGIGCFHYLPDDITGGGQWLFRENADDTPDAVYGGSTNVPSLLYIR